MDNNKEIEIVDLTLDPSPEPEVIIIPDSVPEIGAEETIDEEDVEEEEVDYDGISNNSVSDALDTWRENEIRSSDRYEYKNIEQLGKGTFGVVLKCSRTKTCGGTRVPVDPVAVKIFKSEEEAYKEVIMLLKIKRAAEFCIEMKDYFVHIDRTHVVLELLEITLADYLHETRSNMMPVAVIKRVARDILRGLVKLEELGIVHADLKPENIMIASRATFRTKLIDFGWAHEPDTQQDQEGTHYMQTRFYRSPEIILNDRRGYSFGIDMWSVGCIIGELLTYRPLFPGKCNYDLLRYIIDSLGLPDQEIIRKCRAKKDFFTKRKSDLRWELKTSDEFLNDVRNGEERITEKVEYSRHRSVQLGSIHRIHMPNDLTGDELHQERFQRSLLLLVLQKMLKWDQRERISPSEALEHPFFTGTRFPWRNDLRVRSHFGSSLRLVGPEDVQQTAKGEKRSADETAEIGFGPMMKKHV